MSKDSIVNRIGSCSTCSEGLPTCPELLCNRPELRIGGLFYLIWTFCTWLELFSTCSELFPACSGLFSSEADLRFGGLFYLAWTFPPGSNVFCLLWALSLPILNPFYLCWGFPTWLEFSTRPELFSTFSEPFSFRSRVWYQKALLLGLDNSYLS